MVPPVIPGVWVHFEIKVFAVSASDETFHALTFRELQVVPCGQDVDVGRNIDMFGLTCFKQNLKGTKQ